MTKQAHIVDLHEMGRVNPLPVPPAWWATIRLGHLLICGLRGARIRMEGFPESIDGPVLFAMNHTHRYDFLPAKVALDLQRKIVTATVVKYRAFQHRGESLFMRKYGNIPISSRGYLISADFTRLHGRKPTEPEYRVMRDHVDGKGELPDAPPYRALQQTPRDLLGLPFSPSEGTWRQMILRCYEHAMEATVGLCRRAIDAGHSIHVYPEGLLSLRLGEGHIGTVEMAVALGVPIVPVGLSGMNVLYERCRLLPARAGTLTMRFGRPYRIQRPELEAFRPFTAEHEVAFRPILEQETDRLMDAINDLLEPECRRGAPGEDPGYLVTGIGRFFD